ncbi:MAG: hypothetical protein EHM35_09715, partial [Planctomycetaceae bacterium]
MTDRPAMKLGTYALDHRDPTLSILPKALLPTLCARDYPEEMSDTQDPNAPVPPQDSPGVSPPVDVQDARPPAPPARPPE